MTNNYVTNFLNELNGNSDERLIKLIEEVDKEENLLEIFYENMKRNSSDRYEDIKTANLEDVSMFITRAVDEYNTLPLTSLDEKEDDVLKNMIVYTFTHFGLAYHQLILCIYNFVADYEYEGELSKKEQKELVKECVKIGVQNKYYPMFKEQIKKEINLVLQKNAGKISGNINLKRDLGDIINGFKF